MYCKQHINLTEIALYNTSSVFHRISIKFEGKDRTYLIYSIAATKFAASLNGSITIFPIFQKKKSSKRAHAPFLKSSFVTY